MDHGDAPAAAGSSNGMGGERGTVRRLLTASFLMLFLELALIRWLGANIVHLSYFSNFVLLGSFLGIGLGFLISRKTLVGAARSPRRSWRCWWSARCLFPVTIDRAGRRRHLLHLAEHHRAAGVAGAAGHLRAGGGRCWPGRPRSSAAASADLAPADRLPLGPDRLADRHRRRSPCCRSCGRRPWCGASLVTRRRSWCLIGKLAALPGRASPALVDGRRCCCSRR